MVAKRPRLFWLIVAFAAGYHAYPLLGELGRALDPEQWR